MTFAADSGCGCDAPVHIYQEITMKKFLALILGTALAGGMAVAQEPQDPMQDPTEEPVQQEPTEEQTTEYGEEVGERDPLSQSETTQSQAQDPTHTEDPMQTEDPTMGESTTQAHEMEMQHGLSDMGVEELQGMTVVTATGEEIGEIDRVGQSEMHQERIATVDVGGFLGVAEKTIAIPLSELEMSSDGHAQTTLTKETIESSEEFDDQGFTEEGGEQEDTGY
jgi:hypothetical protein